MLVAAIIVMLAFTTVLGIFARRERDRAETNLQLARQAVDQSLSSAGRQQARESADPPAMEAFRKELLDKAATFYAAFIHEDSSNLKLRADAAEAHSRLGDVNRLLDRPEDAIREYKQAIAGFASLANQHPREVEYRRALAYCHNWLGETLRLWSERDETPDPSEAGAGPDRIRRSAPPANRNPPGGPRQPRLRAGTRPHLLQSRHSQP